MVVVECCGWYAYICVRFELLWSLSGNETKALLVFNACMSGNETKALLVFHACMSGNETKALLASFPRLSCTSRNETKTLLASFPGSHACLGWIHQSNNTASLNW